MLKKSNKVYAYKHWKQDSWIKIPYCLVNEHPNQDIIPAFEF